MGESGAAPAPPPALPAGVVTFLFTDLEGSTGPQQAHPAAYRDAVRRHHDLLRDAVEASGGRCSRRWGTRCTPPSPAPPTPWPRPWPGSGPSAGRTGARRGPCGRGWASTWGRWSTRPGAAHGARYFGLPLVRCARLMATAHGGQVVLSAAAAVVARRPARGGGPARPGRAPAQGPGAAGAGVPTAAPRAARPSSRRSHAGRGAAQPAPAADQLRRPGAGAGRGGRAPGRTRAGDAHRRRGLRQDAPGPAGGRRGGRPLPGRGLARRPGAARRPALVPPPAPPRSEAPRPARLRRTLAEHCAPAPAAPPGQLRAPAGGCAPRWPPPCCAVPGVRVLATSRERSASPGRPPGASPPWACPAPRGRRATPPGSERSEAVRLFVDRARAVSPAFALTAANAPPGGRLPPAGRDPPGPRARRGAGAGALPGQLAARLGDRFRLLTGGGRTALRRQQTLRAALDWSYDLLSGAEQALLPRLAVFAGRRGLPLEAAEAVGRGAGDRATRWRRPTVLDLLTGLVDKSWCWPRLAGRGAVPAAGDAAPVRRGAAGAGGQPRRCATAAPRASASPAPPPGWAGESDMTPARRPLLDERRRARRAHLVRLRSRGRTDRLELLADALGRGWVRGWRASARP